MVNIIRVMLFLIIYFWLGRDMNDKISKFIKLITLEILIDTENIPEEKLIKILNNIDEKVREEIEKNR